MIGDGFKALADPTRRRVLELLGTGDMTAGELAEHFSMTKATLSHHLDILAQAHLVERERRGRNVVYSLNSTVFQSIVAWFYTVSAPSKPAGMVTEGVPPGTGEPDPASASVPDAGTANPA